FETEALGPTEVKGKVEPVPVFRVLGPKQVPGKVRGIEGLESPLVGRELEFGTLLEALERLRAGVGGIVTITGEAGIGKSRLVAEVRRCHPEGTEGSRSSGDEIPFGLAQGRLRYAQNDRRLSVQWVEGRCLSYGTSTAYLLWLDVLREWIAVASEDRPERVATALRDRVQMLCPERFDDVYPYLARLISLPLEDEEEAALSNLEGEKLKARTFQAVEELIECAAQQRPLAIVCEDLHWADPTSIELLEQLLALTDRVSVLFICVFRPDPEHGSWRMRETAARIYRHRHTSLHLQPLSVLDSASLVSNLLQAAGAPAGGVEDLPPPLKERILQVTEGNPLYVEEVLRSLVDEGALVRDESSGRWRGVLDVVDIALPGTLQGVLLSRIDRLQEEAKRVLQMASVIGRIFLYRVLEAIAKEERELDRHLLTLQRQEMIRERTRIPELGYIFKHELTREAAYNGLLKKQRRLFHRQVAEALERLFPDRIEEQLGLLAHHWERAGVSDRAVDYMVRAGDQAQREYACREAIEHYTRALELVEAARVPDQALAASILERRAKAYIAPDGMGLARQDLHRVLAWSRLVGNRRKEAETLLDLIMPLLTGHEIDEAMACAQQANDIAVALEDNLLVARSTGALGGAYCTKGELDKANTYLQAALAAGKATGATECVGEALFYAMMERNWVADFRGALALVAETMELAEEVRDPNWAYRALFVGALANCGLGEYELALATLSQAEELAEKA
ncbi:MAG: AAA family ATPase, partial [Anaerolineales bacterium]